MMNVLRLCLAISLATTVSCDRPLKCDGVYASQDAIDCAERYPATSGAGFGENEPGQIQAMCEDANGTCCDASLFLGLDGAYCVAQRAGMPEFQSVIVEELTVTQFEPIQPMWVLWVVTAEDECVYETDRRDVHAVTGEILYEDGIFGDSCD